MYLHRILWQWNEITDRGADFEMSFYQVGMLRILSIVTRWPTGYKPVLPCECGNHSSLPLLRVKDPKSKVFLRVTSSKKAVLYENPPESSYFYFFSSSVFYMLFFKSLLRSALSNCLLSLPLCILLYHLFSCPSFARLLVGRPHLLHRLPVYVLLYFYFYFISSSVSIVVLDRRTPPSLANSSSENLCFASSSSRICQPH
jgi:hypothetical protein